MTKTKVATAKAKDAAKRTLVWFSAALVALAALLGFGVVQSDAQWTPKLGLDLEGGTQIILAPRVNEGQSVNREQLDQARDIIAQRVDSQGTTGAEVTTQGDSNVVVAMPGTPTKQQEEAISASSQMQFRPVLATDLGSPQAAEPQPTPTTSGGKATPSPTSGKKTSSPAVSERSSSSTPASRDQQRSSASPTSPKPTATSKTTSGSKTTKTTSGKATPSSPAPTQDWKPSGKPTSPVDPNHISTKLWKQFQDLDCSKADDKPVETKGPIVACGQDGGLKYILGPVVVPGDQIDDASAGYAVSAQGQQTNEPEIQLSFKGEGRKAYGDISKTMVAQPSLGAASNPPGSYNALATVLDSKVLIAPGFNEAIPSGRASISGFQIDEARALAQSLKFGALPISFDLQTRQEISPTLGSEQLRYGIIAGLIGLLLVVLYSVFQYRALAIVTIGSMVVAFLVTYLAIALLSWQYNYRLDMAGVTGLIIAIGVTADSFIVYFERVRDELRDGRNLRAAVEAGWARAKRTILVADGVNLIAAIILYILASSGVRGFAFTLGLTTLIDLLIFWVFTHPLLTLLARNKFFSSGHPWSGFDVGSLSKPSVRYTGRGQVAVRPGATATEGGAS